MTENQTQPQNDPNSLGEYHLPNKYRGICQLCGTPVKAQQGWAIKTHADDGDTRGGWIVIHRTCPAEPSTPPLPEHLIHEGKEVLGTVEYTQAHCRYAHSQVGSVLAESPHWQIRQYKHILLPHPPVSGEVIVVLKQNRKDAAQLCAAVVEA